MSGIVTAYNGITFRSRVEAKWAFVFDALGISWAYEPIDLLGYIPDFIIETRFLVEIKSDIDDDTMRAAQLKIERSGWDGEAAILQPTFVDASCQPLVGSFGELETGPDGAQLVWGDCRMMRCTECSKVSLFPGCGSWRCRSCGFDGGNSHVGPVGFEFFGAWAEAGNRFQWRPS